MSEKEDFVMSNCIELTPDMLPNRITVDTETKDMDLMTAKSIADEKIRGFTSDPFLLAWFDRKAGKYSPDVECCDYGKPAWLVYAESRGGGMSVDINDQEYVFVYAAGECFP
jgi:hypothetical protein